MLLDTHAFLWWLAGSSALTRRARNAIAGDTAEVFISAVSAWEISTKYRLGKLPEARLVAEDVAASVTAEGFAELALSMSHAQRAGDLVGHHRDPFDRMLIAQSMLENMTLVSNERAFDAYGVKRLW
ncbi:MAG: type II toxin-antitoxin system VapC family toxin [Reyranella sp.]|uniref:type II toxin-antitoxin system VapC family toxin n=1 Tax=Reyranella sp. TaxID=1929291 RepID=UPI0027309005|nr:type II toxin-antitoxin system VapC family toxin [Reyranella sp.]MDP1967007.1 type II toxin-antitoxin system VapC family toxin [Reyranella sp.]MDP2378688.1 type II toxin-antitoxin system VapC family toxin [Reyranella sp.]